jgi:plasmid stabilization system protein ParE
MARAFQRPAARRDFLIHYAYLLEHASLPTAKRFRQAVERSYSRLANNPGLGAPHKLRHAKYSTVRLWPVRGFASYLIAYRPYRGGIAVERLIHAKQDYQRVLR